MHFTLFLLLSKVSSNQTSDMENISHFEQSPAHQTLIPSVPSAGAQRTHFPFAKEKRGVISGHRKLYIWKTYKFMQLASYWKSEAYRKKELTKDNPTCKRAIPGSFLQDQSPLTLQQGKNSCGEGEEEGGQWQGGAEQIQRHPTTTPACSQPWHQDPVRVAPAHKHLTGRGQQLFLEDL